MGDHPRSCRICGSSRDVKKMGLTDSNRDRASPPAAGVVAVNDTAVSERL
jgi:hypothetical protein